MRCVGIVFTDSALWKERKMTRKEAIQWLEAMKSAYALPIETYEAIDMAIEALNREQQIIENGYTGKEMRIRIGGKLFAVRELAQ